MGDAIYRATAAALSGGLTIDGRPTAALPGPVRLRVSETAPRRLELDAGDDPPGSVWWALGVGLVAEFVVGSLLHGPSGLFVPGWLVGYFVVTLARRRRLTLDLLGSSAVLVDDRKSRLAFETTLDGRTTWVAFQVKDGFGAACRDVRESMGDRVRDGRVGRSVRALVELGVVVLFLGGLALLFWATAHQ